MLQLVLFDGYYYDEIISDEYKNKTNKPFIKSKFKDYIININIGKINQIDFDEVNDINQYSMMNINQLDFAIDSLKRKREIDIDVRESKMITRSNYKTLDYNLNKKAGLDYYNKDFFRLFQIKKQKQLFDLGISSIKSTISIIKSNKTIQLYRTQNLNKHIITLHDKFSLGFACIILFFIGAPLGTIIKKGGYGLPLVISILLFLAYHFLGIFSKNLAEDGSISPILSSWLSTIVMLPISIYLTHKATNDGSSNKLYSFFINLYNTNK